MQIIAYSRHLIATIIICVRNLIHAPGYRFNPVSGYFLGPNSRFVSYVIYIRKSIVYVKYSIDFHLRDVCVMSQESKARFSCVSHAMCMQKYIVYVTYIVDFRM